MISFSSSTILYLLPATCSRSCYTYTFLCLTDFLGTDAFIRKAIHLAFASATIVQTISAIAVLKGKPLEAVIDFGVVFHSALLTVPSSLG